MVMRKPYLFVLAIVVGISFSTYKPRYTNSHNAPLPTSGNDLFVSSSSLLSRSDQEHYAAIFTSQKKADWQTADGAIAKLNNKILLGHVYAERYLNHSHKATGEELKAWLEKYADHPQAYDIALLAKVKTPADYKKTTLQGYGDDTGLAASFGDSKHAGTWRTAISKWRSGDKAGAATLFTSMLKDDNLPEWKKSAASFWAYRSYDALGNKAKARKYLELAATEPRSFYGIMASKKLRKPLPLDKDPIALENSNEPLFKRITALSEIGKNELAEKEIRAAFPQAAKAEKFQLLALAHELNLASVQIAMARQLATDERPLDFARYPTAHWQPQNGFKVDPALIHALVRQESGFRASAVSPSGALGLMQLMPKTASYMKKRMTSESIGMSLPELTTNEYDPTFNVALGQEYVQHLLDNDLVEGNMIYMLVAYNAGAGRLADWKNSIKFQNDPLLFVESIPFAETRHYVMQVMTNYWIYSELAGNPSSSVYALLGGKWPEYDKQSTPVAADTIRSIIENHT